MNRYGNIFFCLCTLLLLAAGVGRAETFFWSDNFETNAGSRWTTNSIWQIGSPAIGPSTNSAGYRTHSGANCATTGLKSNYPYNADSRLICSNYNGASSFVVPSADQFPRLRFWHWFNFVNALGYVEISSGGGNWQQISTNYINMSSSGVWSRPSIDLRSFAGQSVQIAFHFTSGGNVSGNAPGWYIDDIAVVTGAPVFNNPEGFESGLGDWSVDSGTWEVGTPTAGPGNAHGGTNCAASVLTGKYGPNVDSRLISPAFAVPSNSPALRFWHWYNFPSPSDALGYVEISANAGSWQPISPNYIDANTSGNWTNVSLDLSAYAGQTAQVAFHFTSLNGGTAGKGWYVDDISLVASPTLTVPPTQTIFSGQTLVVTNYATLLPTNGMPRFALVSGPTGVNLDTNTGVLSWVTTLTQPAGTYTNVIMVTDNNSPPLSTTNSFVVVVTNPWAPILTVPPTQTIYAGQTLVVTNYATNDFFPNDTFTFALLSGPTNMDVSNLPNTGVLRWATTTAQPAGTYTNVITVVDGMLQLSATNSFVIVVSNPPPPVLTVPPTQAIYAGQTLVVTNYATNSVFPNCTFAFEIVSAPAGVSIDPASGVLTWTPIAAQAPSYNSISVKVTDNNSPPLSAIAGFSVLVSATPPPVLTVPPTQIIYAGQTLVVTNYANSVLPNTTFTFGIVSAPTNVFINATSGVLTWTNTAPSVFSTNAIFVFVTDNSTLLGATNNFTVIILPNPPVLEISATNGFQLTFDTFSNTTWRIDASTNLSSWLPLLTNTAGPGGTIQFTDSLATNYPWRFYRAVLQ